MFEWLRRLFRRKKAAPPAPGLTPAELGVVPQGYDNEAGVRTSIVNRAQQKQLQEARALVQENPELTFSQAHAALSLKDEGPRAEIVIQPEDGMALPILPADLAPETMAIPRVADDFEVTRRLPPLSERESARARRRGPSNE